MDDHLRFQWIRYQKIALEKFSGRMVLENFLVNGVAPESNLELQKGSKKPFLWQGSGALQNCYGNVWYCILKLEQFCNVFFWFQNHTFDWTGENRPTMKKFFEKSSKIATFVTGLWSAILMLELWFIYDFEAWTVL